jgi:hypothetical protein
VEGDQLNLGMLPIVQQVTHSTRAAARVVCKSSPFRIVQNPRTYTTMGGQLSEIQGLPAVHRRTRTPMLGCPSRTQPPWVLVLFQRQDTHKPW